MTSALPHGVGRRGARTLLAIWRGEILHASPGLAMTLRWLRTAGYIEHGPYAHRVLTEQAMPLIVDLVAREKARAIKAMLPASTRELLERLADLLDQAADRLEAPR